MVYDVWVTRVISNLVIIIVIYSERLGIPLIELYNLLRFTGYMCMVDLMSYELMVDSWGCP